MIIRNSLRQLKRTPVRSGLFFVLISGATALLVLSSILWLYASTALKSYSNSFSTIGTVEQEQQSTEKIEVWDAEQQTFLVYTQPAYSELIEDSVMEMSGVNYIYQAEKRPYYGAYCPEYELYENQALGSQFLVVEVSPIEDCIPDHPVQMKVEKVLYGTAQIGTDIWICDHENFSPNTFYAENTYIMGLAERPAHKEYQDAGYEYMLLSMESTQHDSNGNLMTRENGNADFYDLITDDFVNSLEGEKWKNIVEAMDKLVYTLPIQPVENTNLLLPFYNGSAYVAQGRDITKEEYGEGSSVCLISQEFAKRNNIKEGDKIKLPFYYADYQNSPGSVFHQGGWSFRFGILNAENKVYQTFYENNYTVVGIYGMTADLELGREYQLGTNEIIVPAKSVKKSDASNIIAFGPMRGFNTSFQIPNGTIEEFMKCWEEKRVEGLNIQFYDKGYTELKQGIDNMEKMSILLLVIGLFVSFFLLLFFGYIFIVKQRKRVAIERAMGMTQKQSRKSLVSGVAVVIAAGAILGCVAGTFVSGYAIEKSKEQQTYFDETYSNGTKAGNDKTIDIGLEKGLVAAIVVGQAVFVTFISHTIILLYSRKVLRESITKSLTDKEE